MGISEVEVLSKLLDVNAQKIEDLTSVAKEKGYISQEGELTELGNSQIAVKEDE